MNIISDSSKIIDEVLLYIKGEKKEEINEYIKEEINKNIKEVNKKDIEPKKINEILGKNEIKRELNNKMNEMNQRKIKLSNNQEEDIWQINKSKDKQLEEQINDKYNHKINLSNFEKKNNDFNQIKSKIIQKVNTKDEIKQNIFRRNLLLPQINKGKIPKRYYQKDDDDEQSDISFNEGNIKKKIFYRI